MKGEKKIEPSTLVTILNLFAEKTSKTVLYSVKFPRE